MSSSAAIQPLHDAIRDVPDFPKPGILFKDITPVLGDPDLLRLAMTSLIDLLDGQKVDKIVGIDARGFIFATGVALELNAGLVPIRKSGKLPWKTHGRSYSLEYGESEVEIHQDAIRPGEKVMLVDDLLATGGTAAAAQELIAEVGGDLVLTAFLIELEDLKGRERLNSDSKIQAILKY